MSRVIAVSNQKGGVGKSTTAINLSSCLAEKGSEVLLIDMDPQGNTTSGIGIEKSTLEKTVYNVLTDQTGAKSAVVHTQLDRLDILPANEDLSSAEIDLMDSANRETRLKKSISKLKKNYDFVLIDCPPSLSLLTINALAAADSVLIPIQCEYYALEGLTQMLHTIDQIKERINPDIKIEGILFTMYDARTNLSAEVVQNVKDNLNTRIFQTIIPRNVRLAEAPSYGLPINRYDTASAGADSYRKLAEEVLKGKGKNGSKKKWSWKRLGFTDSEE